MTDASTAWQHSSDEPAPQTDRNLRSAVDVAVVGAGYTGLSTALHCAEAGLSVQVIEASRIASGASGQNVGLVNAGLWLPPGDVVRALGEKVGQGFLARFGEAPSLVFDLIERHQIRCAATRTGTIHAADNRRGLDGLVKRHTAWQSLGAPTRLLSPDETAEITGSPAFAGALVDARAGTVNPLAYARGLARAARGAGAAIVEGVAVTALRRDGQGWLVETAEGAVTARAVVLATNAHTGALWPALAQSVTPIHYVQIATEPLGDRSAQILPTGAGLWDTAPIMTSVRRDADGRVILGSMGRLIGTAQAGLTHRWARARLRRLFPDLGAVRFEAAWDGRIALTRDHIPRLHEPVPGLYAPAAYNGRGITTGTLFGAALAAVIATGNKAALPIPLSQPAPDHLSPLRARAYDLAFTANQAWRGLA